MRSTAEPEVGPEVGFESRRLAVASSSACTRFLVHEGGKWTACKCTNAVWMEDKNVTAGCVDKDVLVREGVNEEGQYDIVDGYNKRRER